MPATPASEATPPRAARRARYCFSGFTVSTARRALLRDGREVPLIPRYFDLLVLLLERRHEAVHRREILDVVWRDVVVSDGALSQAVRTLRRALGDASREPEFIRTVSRHGYRFVHPDVVEEPDDGPLEPTAPGAPPQPAPPEAGAVEVDPFAAALQRLLDPALGEDERREAAEALHALGTEEALRRLDARPGHAAARALLRDARWDVPSARPVPFLGQPGALATAAALVTLRLRRAARLAARRWTAAAAAGALAGLTAGGLGGVALCLAPGSATPWSVVTALAIVGAALGGLGAAGVGAGLAAAEAVARSFRGLALVGLGAAGGGTVGGLSHLLGRWTLEGLFGHELSLVGGGFEGVMLGGAAGLGYALSTPRRGGGMATPRGAARLLAALATGTACAGGAVLVALLGGHLGGVSLDFMARQFQGSQVGLAPLARLLGEPELGPITRIALSAYEGALFGAGVALGLTRRPEPASEPR